MGQMCNNEKFNLSWAAGFLRLWVNDLDEKDTQEKNPLIFAPVSKEALSAPSNLSSGIKPKETTRNPPAALQQETNSLLLVLLTPFFAILTPFLGPIVPSSSTVEGVQLLKLFILCPNLHLQP